MPHFRLVVDFLGPLTLGLGWSERTQLLMGRSGFMVTGGFIVQHSSSHRASDVLGSVSFSAKDGLA